MRSAEVHGSAVILAPRSAEGGGGGGGGRAPVQLATTRPQPMV